MVYGVFSILFPRYFSVLEIEYLLIIWNGQQELKNLSSHVEQKLDIEPHECFIDCCSFTLQLTFLFYQYTISINL